MVGTPENLLKIARALGVTVSDLLGDAVREPQEPYRNATDPRAAILADYQAPEGLRDMAQDKATLLPTSSPFYRNQCLIRFL
ncbi:hypothetical protein MIT9_P1504 [Methylomarinovum caldicuralii]|uniref:HTH cro/C1-type domain-containing protein n=1 Tax=Methylomarinovum caldicuralii TaxID=438856 RepID=A0AAU9CVG9_9GAMM|nr:hypothetical protein MIT9_P1504 [Methylomarinovum caldicuralii]